MKNLIVTRRDMVAWSSMLLWILTALIVYLAVGKDWILVVDIFYCVVFALLAKYCPKWLNDWMNKKV